MTISGACDRTLTICTATLLLTGCAGGGSVPIRTPVSSFQHRASTEDLLYVSDSGSKAVYFYTYPGGAKVGELTGTGSPGGLCVDHSGDVFVVNHPASGGANILEYAHGGTTPIRTLDDSRQEPVGCAVSPVTGDLAVTNSCPVKSGECKTYRRSHGDLLIYPHATGTPRAYRFSRMRWFEFCGYDAKGNLFADGSGGNHGYDFEVVELPKGSSSLKQIMIHWTTQSSDIDEPGGIQWDGNYLAIGEIAIERLRPLVFRVDTSTWNIESTLTLHHAYDVPQFFIYGHRLIAPNSGKKGGQVLFYSYPDGVKSTKVIDGLRFPFAVVVSPGTSS